MDMPEKYIHCCDLCGAAVHPEEIQYEYVIDTYMCVDCYYSHPMAPKHLSTEDNNDENV